MKKKKEDMILVPKKELERYYNEIRTVRYWLSGFNAARPNEGYNDLALRMAQVSLSKYKDSKPNDS